MARTAPAAEAAPTTQLRFIATAQGVKVNPARNSYDNTTVDLTVRIEAPKQPRDPGSSWNLDSARRDLKHAFPGGEPPAEEKAEHKKWETAVAKVVRFEAEYRAAKAAYHAALSEHAPQLMAYAHLVGIVSVFGNKRLAITLSPADQDLLPGMGVNLFLADTKANEDGDEYAYDEDLEDEADELEYAHETVDAALAEASVS